MFFEVFEDKIVHSPSEMREVSYHYRTSLCAEPNQDALLTLDLQRSLDLKEWKLGDIEFLSRSADISAACFFPFWHWIYKIRHWNNSGIIFKTAPWRASLLRKWIAWFVEAILLMRYDPCNSVCKHFKGESVLREEQARKYGTTGRMVMREYLQLLQPALENNPNFKPVTFPSWINNPEILQLSEKE